MNLDQRSPPKYSDTCQRQRLVDRLAFGADNFERANLQNSRGFHWRQDDTEHRAALLTRAELQLETKQAGVGCTIAAACFEGARKLTTNKSVQSKVILDPKFSIA